jgi:hypothetical protein
MLRVVPFRHHIDGTLGRLNRKTARTGSPQIHICANLSAAIATLLTGALRARTGIAVITAMDGLHPVLCQGYPLGHCTTD